MRTISLFFSLLLSLTAFGQPSPINRRAFALTSLAQTPLTPPLIASGVAYWWVASDLSSSPVDAWVDRILHLTLTNTGSARPTWDASGVTFNGVDQFLSTTNFTPQVVTAQGKTMFILQFNSISGSGANMIMTDGAGGLWYLLNAGKWRFTAADFPTKPTTGHFIDALGIGNGSSTQLYTNGVLSATNAQALSQIGNKIVVGTDNGPANWFSGVIKEIIIWSNSVAFTNATAFQTISNLHYYSTNTYNYTP